MMFASLALLERIVPIVGIVTTSHGHTSDVLCFGCRNVLMLAMPVGSCGILFCLRKTELGMLAVFLFSVVAETYVGWDSHPVSMQLVLMGTLWMEQL